MRYHTSFVIVSHKGSNYKNIRVDLLPKTKTTLKNIVLFTLTVVHFSSVVTPFRLKQSKSQPNYPRPV